MTDQPAPPRLDDLIGPAGDRPAQLAHIDGVLDAPPGTWPDAMVANYRQLRDLWHAEAEDGEP